MTVSENYRLNKKNISWLKKHRFLLIAFIVGLALLVLSIVFATFFPWFNVALSIMIGSSFLYKELKHRAADIKLIDNGLCTPATIIDKDWAYGKQEDFYYITYTFTAHNVQLTGKHEIVESWYKKLEIGEVIDIVFDSTDPNINVPTGGPREIHSLWRIIPASIVITGVTFIGSFFLLLALGKK